MIKRLSLIIVIVTTLLCGCKTMSMRDTSQISISRPLVSSRESLVLDRQRELTWLNSQLNMPITHGIQGRRFTRDITSLTGSLSVQADPTVIKKYKAQQELDLDNISRFSEISKITHENKLLEEKANAELNAKKSTNYLSYINNIIELDNLRTELLNQTYESQKAIKDGVCGGKPENQVLDKDGNPINCEHATSRFIEALDALKAELPTGEQISSVLKPGTSDYITGFKTETIKDADENDIKVLVPIYGGTLDYSPTDSQSGEALAKIKEVAGEVKTIREALKVDKTSAADASTLSVTAIESFEDDLAYRTRVNDQIAKVKLDERHDTYGNTLYRLQYAITVVPRDDNPHWAKVEVEVRPESTTLYPRGIFKWMYNISKKERSERNTKFISPLIESNADIKKPSQDEVNKLLQRMSDYYDSNRDYLPRSVGTWTDNFLIAMRKEIRNKYNKTLDAWDNHRLSEDQKLLLDKQLGTICYDTGKYNNLTFFQRRCDKENKVLGVAINTPEESGKGQPKYYRDYGNLDNDLYNNSTISGALKKELQILQHYVIALHSVSEVSRDFDFLKYVIVNYPDIKPDRSTNTFADAIYLTWIKAKEQRAQTGEQETQTEEQKNPKPINKGLWQLLSDLTAGYTADVYSVYPDESAQRIEDVAVVIKMFGFDLGAQFLAGNVGGEAAISYLKGKEKLFSTILRKPVVIGLPGETLPAECVKNGLCNPKGIKFGWIIGPVYKIKNDRQDAEFVQSATKKIVSADVSLPAWWRSLSMKAKVSWISSKDLDEMVDREFFIATDEDPVYLPARQPDFREMIRFSPRPIIEPEVAEKTKINGEDPMLILKGKNMWRVHAVSIGNETSDQIEILGDMEAIKVEFPKLTQSACKSFIDYDENAAPECKSVITLWSRNAKSIIYDAKAKIVWKKPVSRPIATDKIKLTSILPAEGMVIDPSKEDKKPVKILGKGIPKEALGESVKTKWNINFGDATIKEAIARDEGSDGQSLSFNFPQKESWGATCHDVKPGKSCEIKIRVYYDDKLLKNGILSYKLTKKTE